MDTSMIANKLQDLIQSKSDIKSALAAHNVEPVGGLPTYADAINDIQILIEESVDFSILGYDDNAIKAAIAGVQDDINYSKSIYDTQPAPDFYQNYRLVYCPLLDTSKVTNMNSMFAWCYALSYIPKLDTSKVTSMYEMFRNCFNLQTIPLLDTSNVVEMYGMFDGCTNLQTIPLLDTSKVTSTAYMFSGCENLQTIPLLDTSKVTMMYNMFHDCTNLQTIPQLNTSNVTNMMYMFSQCRNIESIPQLDTSNVASMYCTFYICPGLKNVGGFINLGRHVDLDTTNMFMSTSNLTHDSIMNIINNLYNRSAAGYSAATLPLGLINLRRISDSEKQIAINKGWILS